MARPKNQTPTYKLHKSTGLARCWVNGKWVTLGKYGSPESKAEFARITAEYAAAPASAAIPTTRPGAGLTIDQVLVPYWQHVVRHYRTPAGKPTTEVDEIKRSLAPLQRLYGHTSAAEFGPKALAAVRQEMITAGWCRTLINRRMERVRRLFRWATSQELVPVTVYTALRTLPGLEKGHRSAGIRTREARGPRPRRRGAAASQSPRPNDGRVTALHGDAAG